MPLPVLSMCAQALLAVAAARPVPATAAPPAVTASQPVEALSGRLEIITGFGDERLAIAEPGTKQPEHYPLTARISRIWGIPPVSASQVPSDTYHPVLTCGFMP